MIDNEHGWESRELSGESVALCDHCGLPVENSISMTLPGETASAVEMIQVCATCFAQIEQGQLPIDPEPDDEFSLTI